MLRVPAMSLRILYIGIVMRQQIVYMTALTTVKYSAA